jgi:hypothetical protein
MSNRVKNRQCYLPNVQYLALIEEAKQMLHDQEEQNAAPAQPTPAPVSVRRRPQSWYRHKNVHVTIYSECDIYEFFDVF